MAGLGLKDDFVVKDTVRENLLPLPHPFLLPEALRVWGWGSDCPHWLLIGNVTLGNVLPLSSDLLHL